MASERGTLISRALTKLEKLGHLPPQARSALIAQLGEARAYPKGAEVVRQGDSVRSMAILVDGFAIAVRTLPAGAQQTAAMFIPGDIMGWADCCSQRASAAVRAITSVKLMPISHDAIADLLDRDADVNHVMMRNMAVDFLVAQEWLVSLGRRTAAERLAHFLCEMFVRLRRVDLAHGADCDFPLTQEMLADTLGLSVVHTNRMLQQLRGRSLIELQHGHLHILDWVGLAEAGAFEADYLALAPHDLVEQ